MNSCMFVVMHIDRVFSIETKLECAGVAGPFVGPD